MKGADSGDVKLELRNLRKVFDGVEAVKESNLVLKRGEFLSLLGPSGCGKSTTLAMIAGFLEPTSGEILIDGNPVTHVPVQKRRIGLVFQDYAIFTKMSVRKNLLFGLEAQKIPRVERDKAVDEFAEKLNLKGLMKAHGGDLNMSEMQRVALARVLVTKPELLLLDEPMSNLDAALRASLRGELKRIQKDLGQTVLYVTHDQIEAMSMSDRIAVMNLGENLQVASPDEIYHRPKNRFVAEFIGDPPINMISCRVAGSGGSLRVSTEAHKDMPFEITAVSPGDYLLGVRAHHIMAAHGAFQGSIAAVVKLVENFGSEHVLHVTYGQDLMTVMVRPGFARAGDSVHVSFDLKDAHLVDRSSGAIYRPDEREAAA